VSRHFATPLSRSWFTRLGVVALLLSGCAGDTGPLASPASGSGGTSGGAGGSDPSAGAGSGASGGDAGTPNAAGGAGQVGTAGAAPGGGAGDAAGTAGSGRGGDAGRGGGGSGGAGRAGSDAAGSSGGGGKAGAAGAAGSAAGGGAGAPGCAGLPLCEDFEAYAEDSTPNGVWSKQGGGTARVDASRPHRGAQSVHIVTGESEGGRVWLRTTTDRLFPTRHFFGRMWMYLDALPTTEVHWDMIEAQGTADEPEAWDDPFEIALRYGGQLDENFLANFETPGSYGGEGPRTDCAKFSETRMPFGRWACMEWELDADAEVMRFWLDGEAIEDLEVHKEGTQCISDGTDGVWYYPTFESLNLGWREWWEAGTRELWLDDVALATERIGCD
jgi:hypothetical protein